MIYLHHGWRSFSCIQTCAIRQQRNRLNGADVRDVSDSVCVCVGTSGVVIRASFTSVHTLLGSRPVIRVDCTCNRNNVSTTWNVCYSSTIKIRERVSRSMTSKTLQNSSESSNDHVQRVSPLITFHVSIVQQSSSTTSTFFCLKMVFKYWCCSVADPCFS